MTREEAIKILKARPYSGEVLEALETLVPEYNESEDEKIRKALLDYFSCTGDDNLMLNGVYVKDIIAYLDKMKEKEWNEEDKKTIDEICNVIVANSKDGYLGRYSACELVGKLKSLCPQPKQEWSEEEYGRLFDIEHYLEGTLQLSPDRKIACIVFLKSLCPQPKQEWSKEDEKMLLSIINAFRDGAVSTIGQEQWLKFLPERFNLQPKQEWTKEDESYLQTVINEMEANKKEAPEYEHKKYDTIILWLKFLPLSLKKRNEDIEKLCSNEWSEEDEERLMELISLLKEAEGYLNEHGNMFSYNPMLLRKWLKSFLEKVKNGQPPIENEKPSKENILDKPNNVNDVKFPFKAKIKANNKTVIISFGRLNKDRNQWIMYISDYTNNFKEYMPKELELIKDE